VGSSPSQAATHQEEERMTMSHDDCESCPRYSKAWEDKASAQIEAMQANIANFKLLRTMDDMIDLLKECQRALNLRHSQTPLAKRFRKVLGESERSK
jgi:hypothetical protein